MIQVFMAKTLMTECSQGKPDKDDNPRVYITFNASGNEFKCTAYGQAEDYKQEPLPLDYTLGMSTRTYGNDTSFFLETIHIDDPLNILAYVKKVTGDK